MYAVGRLGSYISRGVYTVSGPFHPFGGAVDIIVVRQKDGSFKSSPWYVRFGKFQGVLKAKEKLVKINVNGVDSDFYMHLDHKGEAYFIREVDSEEKDSLSYVSSSGDDSDVQSPNMRRPMKSKSCNFEAVDVSNGKIRTKSRRPRILGFVLGRRSMKGDVPPRPLDQDDCSSGVIRTGSWDRAEIAADLLEVRWSTNLASPKHRKDDNNLGSKMISTSDDHSGVEMGSLNSESADETIQNPKMKTINKNKRAGNDESTPTQSHNSSDVSDETEDSEEEQQLVFGDDDADYDTKMGSSRIDIPGSGKAAVGERKIAESLPNNIQSHLNIQNKNHSLSCSLDSNAEPQIQKELHVGLAENAQVSDGNKHVGSMKPDSAGGNWRVWPFPFKRATSEPVHRHSKASKAADSVNGGKKEKMKKKKKKKKLRELTPTSEQLLSLNLKEGPNTVTFTFSTSMLGPQQVEARIYVWNWNTRIVISDVDGTITKSDVLGQFMPLVGIDWSQNGVTHLFSSIKENGYELLFLSARAISQAHITKQFLLNLKQDGKALPEGPVIISPDGLFPSLFREVIRRAPHEFKIACLEDIKALFPPDHNPFYAGFGNRDTDEISYLKVGIPIGKIFIINPKGEVVVNRQVDTKSYPSIHVLVHDMFPPPSLPEQEDFNSWNFWKLPPPAIDR